jgi:potassium efflux system protein
MSLSSDLTLLVPLIGVAVVVAAGYLISRAVVEALRRHGAPPQAVRATRVAITVVSGILIALIVFVAFGPLPPVGGLTVSAILGLAATLALQTTIANVIAGALLLRNRMLRLGDQVLIGGTSGKVVQLGLVTTWLRLEDGSVASVSNSTLLNGPLVNQSAGARLKGEY